MYLFILLISIIVWFTLTSLYLLFLINHSKSRFIQLDIQEEFAPPNNNHSSFSNIREKWNEEQTLLCKIKETQIYVDQFSHLLYQKSIATEVNQNNHINENFQYKDLVRDLPSLVQQKLFRGLDLMSQIRHLTDLFNQTNAIEVSIEETSITQTIPDPIKQTIIFIIQQFIIHTSTYKVASRIVIHLSPFEGGIKLYLTENGVRLKNTPRQSTIHCLKSIVQEKQGTMKWIEIPNKGATVEIEFQHFNCYSLN